MTILKVIEVLAQSNKSWEDAAQQAVKDASKTVRNITMTWKRLSRTARLRTTGSTPRYPSCSKEAETVGACAGSLRGRAPLGGLGRPVPQVKAGRVRLFLELGN